MRREPPFREPRRARPQGRGTLAPDDWEAARPLLEREFSLLEIVRLLVLRRSVQRGARHEGHLDDQVTRQRLAFARWLVDTGRLQR